MFELKPITKQAVPKALEKAEHYRLLNEPHEAESICLDIMEKDPDNQKALTVLVLALSDQLDEHTGPTYSRAHNLLDGFDSEYAKVYYGGLLRERRANACMKLKGMGWGGITYEWLRGAMEDYERAIEIAPKGNDDAILRWNTCARVLNGNPNIQAPAEESFRPLLE